MVAVEALWERLGTGKTLRGIAKAKRSNILYERALLAMTANRLCVPESKLGVASVAEIGKDVLAKRGRYQTVKDNLQAKEVIIGDGERRRRYILCYNPREAERQRLHREEVVKELEEKLARHPDKKATAKWAIGLFASKRCKRYLKINDTDEIRIDRATIRAAKRYDGKWVIETNDDTITLQDAANGYRGLLVIERRFRSLKRTQIKMMPMYHWAPRRIETHLAPVLTQVYHSHS